MNADADGYPDFENPEPAGEHWNAKLIREQAEARKKLSESVQFDVVTQPGHYNTGRFKHFKGCGQPIEVIDITRGLPGGLSNVAKYVLRAGFKDNELEDLEKAAEYLRDWIAFRRAELGAGPETASFYTPAQVAPQPSSRHDNPLGLPDPDSHSFFQQ